MPWTSPEQHDQTARPSDLTPAEMQSACRMFLRGMLPACPRCGGRTRRRRFWDGGLLRVILHCRECVWRREEGTR